MGLCGPSTDLPIRMPSFKKEDWQKAVDTFQKVRGNPTVLPESDVVIMLDGYKHGLRPHILSTFGTLMKDDTTNSFIYDADQLQSRLGCVCGWKMQQVEWQSTVHNPNGLHLKIRKRCFDQRCKSNIFIGKRWPLAKFSHRTKRSNIMIM